MWDLLLAEITGLMVEMIRQFSASLSGWEGGSKMSIMLVELFGSMMVYAGILACLQVDAAQVVAYSVPGTGLVSILLGSFCDPFVPISAQRNLRSGSPQPPGCSR